VHLKPPLLMLAGAKGAVGSTVAAAVAALKVDPHAVVPWLTTRGLLAGDDHLGSLECAGWDVSGLSLTDSVMRHGVLDAATYLPLDTHIKTFPVRQAPDAMSSLEEQTVVIMRDIEYFTGLYPGTHPVLINLLPACGSADLEGFATCKELFSHTAPNICPDMAYAVAAVSLGIPVVNFTSNIVEIPPVAEEAEKMHAPLCGRDAKTGQTYLKVVLASALKARGLLVDGWYSLNILGNQDGLNLSDHDKASEKIANKTSLLDEILGYQVGSSYGSPTHKVVIDYYPPRGDAKEAWDVIDFKGIFSRNMSLRLNLQARDSVLAAPMVIDLARWMAALQESGRCGLIPELGFYFKKPLGKQPPVTFQDQVSALSELKQSLGV